MNAFIKYLAKEIADQHGYKIINVDVFHKRVLNALISIVGANVYLSDAEAHGLIEKIKDEKEDGQ